MRSLALILVPAALFALVAWLAIARRADPGGVRRPWWGRPALWVGVCATFLLLGLFVTPRLLGFTFLFLPFIWMGSAARDQGD
ncbi:MAG TPA: hypothetical protein VLA90_01750 [Actinomycetota bacterium]|nr:hypothetical protein [Actinomycetota bacterium]